MAHIHIYVYYKALAVLIPFFLLTRSKSFRGSGTVELGMEALAGYCTSALEVSRIVV